MLFKRVATKLSALAAIGLLTSAYADDWHFQVAPYLWALNMNGTVKAGPLKVDVSEDFSDIWHQLNSGAMLFVDAYKGRFGFFFNGLYSVLTQKTTDDGITFDTHTDFDLISGGVTYKVYAKNLANGTGSFEIVPFGGARYTLNDVTVSALGTSVSSDHNWTDPIIGTRLNYNMNQHWSLTASGDIGGTSTSTDYSYNLIGLLGYQPTYSFWKYTAFYAGYRFLYQHYETGSGNNAFQWDMSLFGPVVGLAIKL